MKLSIDKTKTTSIATDSLQSSLLRWLNENVEFISTRIFMSDPAWTERNINQEVSIALSALDIYRTELEVIADFCNESCKLKLSDQLAEVDTYRRNIRIPDVTADILENKYVSSSPALTISKRKFELNQDLLGHVAIEAVLDVVTDIQLDIGFALSPSTGLAEAIKDKSKMAKIIERMLAIKLKRPEWVRNRELCKLWFYIPEDKECFDSIMEKMEAMKKLVTKDIRLVLVLEDIAQSNKLQISKHGNLVIARSDFNKTLHLVHGKSIH